MNRSFRRLALVAALALSLASCAFGKHLDRGDEAFSKGQYQDALVEYEAALRLKPESKEAAEKAQQARQKLVAEACAAANARLGQGDYLGALEAASRALTLLPEAAETKAVVREVSDRSQQMALRLAGEGNLPSALALLESIGNLLPSERGAIEPKAAEVRGRWAALLGERAAAAEKAEHKAEAYLLLAKAAQLVGAPFAERRDAVRAELLERRRYAVQPGGKLGEQERAVLAAVMSSPVPVGLRFLAPGEKSARPDASLRFGLTRPTFKANATQRRDRANYQSGTRTVENPFYRQRQDRVTQEERRLVECENDVTRLESDIGRYQAAVDREGPSPNVSTGAEQSLSNARSRLESERRQVIDQRNQLQRAREELQREQPFKEEPVYSELVYTVTIHTLQGSSAFQASIDHGDGRAGLQVADALGVQVSDEEHAEQAIAGVDADPLQLPARDALVADLRRQAAERLVALTLQSFAGHRQSLLEKAKLAPEADRLDLFALYAFSDPAAVDPSVAMELAARSGVTDALELLAARP